MSDYLTRRIREHDSIETHLGTEVTALHGDDVLIGVDLTSHAHERRQRQRCIGLFCFIGATPATGWLHGLMLDEDGFVLTDTDLDADELPPVWRALDRRPFPFETSVPRVFAVGDVRPAAMKRVAAAAGEGSSAIPSVLRAIDDRG
jgi:thioredoxin reductase (NADPH)